MYGKSIYRTYNPLQKEEKVDDQKVSKAVRKRLGQTE